LLIGEITLDQLPTEMTASHQAVDLLRDPHGWERLRQGLRRAGLDPLTFPLSPGRRPYPGLEPLTEDDAAIFFGREGQIVRALDRLRAMSDAGVERVFIVLGASGAGKSSFLRAGLWPRLKRDDRNFIPLPVMRPERNMMSGKFGLRAQLEAALADPHLPETESLQALPRSRAGLGDLVDKDADGLARIIAAVREADTVALFSESGARPPAIVLSIDQAEELFNEEGRDEAQQFMRLLAHALERDRRLLVIMAIRSDAFPRVQTEPLLAKVGREPFDLPPMPVGSLRLLIEGPAKVAIAPIKVDPYLVDALLTCSYPRRAPQGGP
jgi:hypothetical protein